MTLSILFAAREERWPPYKAALHQALGEAGLGQVHLARDIPAEDVDYIIYAPNSWLQDFTPYTKTKAVLNLWAGVETVVGNATLTQPLCRMVDPALTQGMVEWVTGHVLRHHLGIDAHLNAPAGTWTPEAPPVAWGRKITVLGLGELGRACAASLAALGFDVHGWSQTPKEIADLTCHTDLDAALAGAEGLVLLLPDTPATQNTLNTDTLTRVAEGCFVLNPGRGPLIDDDALIAALDAGQIGHATLDTFREEPLPADHPYWHHPRVTVTPHIASATRAPWAAKSIAENIRRGETGEPFLHLVDRARGY